MPLETPTGTIYWDESRIAPDSDRILKPAIDRERPCHQLTDVRIVPPSCGGTWSFPSNHAANGMAVATVAILVTRRRAA